MAGAASHWLGVGLLLALATGLGLLLDSAVSLVSQAMIYLLGVVVSAYALGRLPSIAMAIGSVLALNFFFVPPRWTLFVDRRDDLIALAALLAVSLLVSHLSHRLRQEAHRARLHADRATQLQELATALGSTATAAAVHAHGLAALQQAFAGPCELVLTTRADDTEDALRDGPEARSDRVRDGLRQCMRDGAVLGPGTGRWPGLLDWYLPIGEAGQVYGAARVAPAQAADVDGRMHATAIAALLGQALTRQALERQRQVARDDAERQQLLNTFLAAVSHDLRTPLAAIVGAASSLSSQDERLPALVRGQMLDTIAREAQRLSRLTENTLQLARLSATPDPQPRPWESLEEIVGSTLTRLRSRDDHARLWVQVAAGLPLVRADAVLLGQLLDNLVENALRYSNGPVDIVADRVGDDIRLQVLDRGPGIPPGRTRGRFEPFRQGDGDGPHGTGLGLALCQAIAQSHGSCLQVHPRPGGGSCIGLALRVELQPDFDNRVAP